MEELNLELNHTYLLRYGTGYTISSATVLMITDRAYYFRWNSGINSVDTWELKSYIDSYYSIVEDISDFVINKQDEVKTLKVETELVQCYVCKGMGTVPNQDSTAGTKICPLCYGSKMIPNVTKIS